MESRMTDREQQSPSDRVQPIRDQLAIDRTILANERTGLAYMRTALTMLIVSIAFIQLVESTVVFVIGWLVVPLAVAVGVAGVILYRRRRDTITRLYGQTPFTTPGLPSNDADEERATDERG
jgi:putative membrane protein